MLLSHGVPILAVQSQMILTKMKWAAQGTGSKSMDADKSSVFQPRDAPAASRSERLSVIIHRDLHVAWAPPSRFGNLRLHPGLILRARRPQLCALGFSPDPSQSFLLGTSVTFC